MNKIFNWTFGSFFRTLGRFAFYILIGYILSCLINFKEIKFPILWDVYAETIKPNYGIDINSNTFDSYMYLGNSKDGNPQNARIEIYQDSINAFDYQFLIVDICATNDIEVYRTANPGNSCTNSCYSNAVAVNKINMNCKSNGYDGKIYRVNTSIVKWYIGSGSSSIYSVNDQFSIVNQRSNNVPISIYGVYISDSENIPSETIDYTQNFNNVINNQDSNTNSIINNNNQNTQDIIDNQNANNQAQIDSQKVCTQYDKASIETDNRSLFANGSLGTWNATGITGYIPLTDRDDLKFSSVYDNSGAYNCFYNVNKEVISCKSETSFVVGESVSIPAGTAYFRATIHKQQNKPTFAVCKNGNQAMIDSLNNDDTTSATNSASSFFNNFNTNNHGLTGIITAPLTAIQSLTSKSCSPLVLPLPFVNENLTLPCMRPIYQQYFGSFMTLYDVITLGIISYWVMVRIFGLVKDFKNPEHDEIEVVDL